MKRCWMCRRTRPIAEFGIDGYRKDGRNNKCRECDARRSSEYYQRRGRQVRSKRPRRLGGYRAGNHVWRPDGTPDVAVREQKRRWAQEFRAREPHLARLQRRRGKARQRATSLRQAVREGQPWTDVDDALVLADDKPVLEIAITLGRTYKSVESRRRVLRGSRSTHRKQRWTPDDDALLNQGYSNAELANMLGRTEAAVQKRRERVIRAAA